MEVASFCGIHSPSTVYDNDGSNYWFSFLVSYNTSHSFMDLHEATVESKVVVIASFKISNHEFTEINKFLDFIYCKSHLLVLNAFLGDSEGTQGTFIFNRPFQTKNSVTKK